MLMFMLLLASRLSSVVFDGEWSLHSVVASLSFLQNRTYVWTRLFPKSADLNLSNFLG